MQKKELLLQALIDLLQNSYKELVQGSLHALEAFREALNKVDELNRERLASLSNGYSRRAYCIKQDIACLERCALSKTPGSKVGVGSLVKFRSSSGVEKEIIIFPRGGGYNLCYEGRKVMSVSQESPIFQEILGKKIGDSFSCRGQKMLILELS